MAWRRARHAEICDVVQPWDHGTAVRCTTMPDWWDYNSVRVEVPARELTAEALIDAVNALQDGLLHRQTEIEDQATGERLRPAFEERGWTAERLVWMARAGAPPAGEDFDEVPFADTRDLRTEWARTLPWMTDAAATQRFIAHEDAVAAMRHTRTLVSRDESGAATGYVTFTGHGDSAEVEQAYVTPALRGRGLGGALVAAAAWAARADETFIVADDEGNPKRLYTRLGFEPVWIQHVFLTRPG